MNWFHMDKIVICIYLLVQFCDSIPHNGNDIAVVETNKNTVSLGCLHNRTMFADTSIVPSSEPCLVCKCSKRNLVCVRRVCKDQPYPPPRGCILVQKKSLCCPYLSCSKYHVNFYKNTERNREHENNYHHQITHEKIVEKNYRTDDAEEEMINGGCIESGSLYASGSAMYRSSASMCSYCYCLNGKQKCIKPKCMLKSTRCKPIFMDASCCPIKYDCSHNSTALGMNVEHNNVNKIANMKRKNRSNGCVENDKYYQEGERLPQNEKRPCEVCYCIKGVRKCAMKKCAPVIRGCIPKVPSQGACCPTSYDCRRSMKFKRESRQENEEEEDAEEDTDTIDFFSLLFGSDDPKEEEPVTDISTTTLVSSTTTSLPPFKALPVTTENSFFDLIRAGLEIIDANADKIDSQINSNVVTTPPFEMTSSENSSTKISNKIYSFAESTEESFEKTTLKSSPEIRTTISSVNEIKKLQTTTEKSKTFPLTSTTLSTKSASKVISTSPPKTSQIEETTRTASRTESSTISAIKSFSTSARAPTTKRTTHSTTTKAPKDKSTKVTKTTATTASPVKINSTQQVKPSLKMTSKAPATTTRKIFTETSKRPEKIITTTSAATTPTMTSSTTTVRTTSTPKYIVPSTLQNHQRLPVLFNPDVLADTKLIGNDENEADTLPNLEIIPFVAHDAIKTDKYEPYRQSYDNLEKDYFANDKEKPFRYNNKFIHHNYDESLDYVYTNPHDRIDNGPYYYETNENQFDSFSPPNEQDFLGGFSPKEESIYDEVSTSANTNHELPLQHNDYTQKPLDKASTSNDEHKSYLTTTEKIVTLAINQTNQTNEAKHEQQQQTSIPDFKKITLNFTNFIGDLFQTNVEDTKAPLISSTTSMTTTAPTTTSTAATSTSSSSTSAPIKSIINDDDFIIKHLKASISTSTSSTTKNAPGLMEIFSKPTNPTMNGLLKLAGCNIYGQMYEVGQIIAELSSPCLECKCLPDIGVGCMPLKC